LSLTAKGAGIRQPGFCWDQVSITLMALIDHCEETLNIRSHCSWIQPNVTVEFSLFPSTTP
jgi:hypothetical protein